MRKEIKKQMNSLRNSAKIAPFKIKVLFSCFISSGVLASHNTREANTVALAVRRTKDTNDYYTKTQYRNSRWTIRGNPSNRD